MLRLEDLAPRQRLALCRLAERLCARRLYSLRRYADPRDDSLLKLLERQSADWRLQLRELEALGSRFPGEPAAPAPPEEVGRLVLSYFPSHAQGFGDGHLDRDVALYLAERMEVERARFYSDMAAVARREDIHSLYRTLAGRESARLEFLRTVLLGVGGAARREAGEAAGAAPPARRPERAPAAGVAPATGIPRSAGKARGPTAPAGP